MLALTLIVCKLGKKFANILPSVVRIRLLIQKKFLNNAKKGMMGFTILVSNSLKVLNITKIVITSFTLHFSSKLKADDTILKISAKMLIYIR